MNITFDVWKKTLVSVFSKNIWPRLILIGALPIVLGGVLSFFIQKKGTEIMMSAHSSALEMGSASVQWGSHFPEGSLFTIAMFLFVYLIVLEIFIFTIGALHISVREYFQRKNSELHTIFEKAKTVFVPFHLYLFRVMWYVAWPMLAVAFVAWVSFVLDNALMGMVTVISLFAGSIIMMYRSLRISFAIPFYFEYEGENRREVFEKALTFSAGKVWKIFLSIFGLGALFAIVGGLLTFILFSVFGQKEMMGSLMNSSSFSMFHIIIQIPNLIFSGVQIVFFYVMYNVMKQKMLVEELEEVEGEEIDPEKI